MSTSISTLRMLLHAKLAQRLLKVKGFPPKSPENYIEICKKKSSERMWCV